MVSTSSSLMAVLRPSRSACKKYFFTAAAANVILTLKDPVPLLHACIIKNVLHALLFVLIIMMIVCYIKDTANRILYYHKRRNSSFVYRDGAGCPVLLSYIWKICGDMH